MTEYLNSLNFSVLPPDFFSSRTFTWTPHCEQSYTYKVMFSGTNVQGKTTKAVQFNIMPPSPEIVAFENQTIISRVGCPVTLSIDTREMDEVLRALDNPNYGQTISVSYSRTEPRGEVVSLDSIPGASFQLEPEPNEWQGLSAKVEWVPSRGQEAFNYTVRRDHQKSMPIAMIGSIWADLLSALQGSPAFPFHRQWKFVQLVPFHSCPLTRR